MARSQISPLAISLGDPAGIGPEVIAKCWDHRSQFGLPPFVAIGDGRSIAAVWDGPIEVVEDPSQADAAFDHALPLIQVSCGPGRRAGTPERRRRALLTRCAGARSGTSAVRFGIRSRHWAGVQGTALRHRLPASRPNGVCCRALRDFAWQRRHDARRCNIADRPGHDAPVAPDVPDRLTQRAHRIARASRPFAGSNAISGSPSPASRVAASIRTRAKAASSAAKKSRSSSRPLPPSRRKAGESRARSPRTRCSTPVPRPTYDAALCMYHDQALIPIKALHFEDAVNVTLGLPIVRTAPDHGTAFDIAGRDRADARPMAAAIRMAAECAAHPGRVRLSSHAEPLRDVIARHGLSASKALGQNFILDRQLLARIAAIPGPLAGQRVYEVGPGPGGLTHALLDAGASVVAVERDRRCIPALEELRKRTPARPPGHRRRRPQDR